MKRILLVMLLSMTAAVWSLAAAEDYGFGDKYHQVRGKERFGRKMERGLSRAGATEAQIERVMALVEKTMAAQDERRNQVRKLGAEVRDEYNADSPDRQKLERLIGRAATLQGQIRVAALNTSLDIREIVGDDVWGKISRRHDDDDDDDDDGWFGRGRRRGRHR